jgi:hypothetical protein
MNLFFKGTKQHNKYKTNFSNLIKSFLGKSLNGQRQKFINVNVILYVDDLLRKIDLGYIYFLNINLMGYYS